MPWSSERRAVVAAAVTAALGLSLWVWLAWQREDPVEEEDDDDIDASIRKALKVESTPLLTGESAAAYVPATCQVGDREYVLQGVLGHGATSIVLAVEDPETHTPLALKVIEKSKLDPPDMIKYVEAEIRIMQELDHPNIVSLVNVSQSPTHILMVQERAMGGELYDRLAKEPYTEKDARVVIAQLLDALIYLHRKGIIHRDLKPENLLLVSDDPACTDVKLCDFGLAKWFGRDGGGSAGDVTLGGSLAGSASPGMALVPPGSAPPTAATLQDVPPPPPAPALLRRASTIVGSQHYHAPEVTSREYSFEVDYYSLGIIVHFMLVGFIPESFDEELFVDEEWESISEDAKAFVGGLLKKNPQHRLTGVQAKMHPWLRSKSLPSKPLLKAQRSISMLYVEPRQEDRLRSSSAALKFLDGVGRPVWGESKPFATDAAVANAMNAFKAPLRRAATGGDVGKVAGPGGQGPPKIK